MLALVALCASLAIVSVSGVVRDVQGGVVAGAAVVSRTSDGTAGPQTVSGPDGGFTLGPLLPGDITITVRAGGFAESVRHVAARQDVTGVMIVLAPASFVDAVTVTASRSPDATGTPAAASVLTAAALESSPSSMLDDQLKTVPGFSLFRRASSRVANPTTQGVTMRGLSASGASRSLVLVDGVPLNDPFGGWVYWDRVPQTALDRVEVVRGGTSELYGADAVGGVIQVLTIAPSRNALRALADYGSRATPRVSLFGGGAAGAWSGFAAGEWQRSDGYLIVAPGDRGPIDAPAFSDYRTAYADAAYQDQAWRAAVRGNVFDENRGNGTPLQVNRTTARAVAGEVSGAARGALWLVRSYYGNQGYDQSFTSVNAARTAETLAQLQRVPSFEAGATGQVSLRIGPASWLFGADVRRTEGTTNERTFTRGVESGFNHAGGVEWETGAFARMALAPTDRLTVTAALRADRWTLSPDSATTPPQRVTELSPKAGVTVRATDAVSFDAVVTHAFRAPTLNELFRNFRVGNTLTSANAGLTPERLTGVEGGATIAHGPASLRVTGFWNRLSDAIANVTVSSTPALTTRRRDNAGAIRVAGVEIEGEWRVAAFLRATASAALMDSIFAESREPGLTGNRVPQVPRYQMALGARVNAPGGVGASVDVRSYGSQWEDDKNALLLRAATITDLSASRAFAGRLTLFGAVENLFDAQYDVGRTPQLTIGLPRTVRGGARVYLP